MLCIEHKTNIQHCCSYNIMIHGIRPTYPPLASAKVSNKWVLFVGYRGYQLPKEILNLYNEVVNLE